MSFFKKHKKTLIIIGSVTAGLVTVGCISLYAIRKKPIRFAFSSYDIKCNDIDIRNVFKRKDGVGNLIVATHSYNPIDQLVMLTELIKYTNTKKNDTCILAYKSKSTKFLVELFEGSHESMVYTTRNNTNTVNKCIEKLNNGQNVIIFLHLGRKSKGIYHIINNSKCNVILSKITHKTLPQEHLDDNNTCINIYSNILSRLFKNYHLEYDIFDKPQQNETPQDYMVRLKQQLYFKN